MWPTPQDEAEVAELAAELDAWRDSAQIPAGPVGARFRLAEPAEAGFRPLAGRSPAVQSADDLSLMISAADIWACDGAGFLGGSRGLARRRPGGGSCWPGSAGPPGSSARSRTRCAKAAPALVELDTPGAFRFLKETWLLLAWRRASARPPAVWLRKARLGLKLTTRSQSPSGTSVTGPRFGLDDLVSFRYDETVGDEALDPAELAELARLKVPLVRLRGQWVELDDEAPCGR